MFYTVIFLISGLAYAKDVAPAPFQNSYIERKLEDGTVQKFDGNEYMIVKRKQKVEKPKEERLVFVNSPKVENKKNRVSIVLGHGPQGNLRETSTEVQTDPGMFTGIQYMRDFGDRNILIQVQTNESVVVGGGVSF